MQVFQTITTKSTLNKSMPRGVLRMVTAEDHNDKFYAFHTTEVWTSDGWLVTAVQDGGITHMRKGNQMIVAKVDGHTMLHYKPTPHTKYMLGEE